MRTIGTPSTQARKLNAIASGALPNGNPVVVNSDGTVSVVEGSSADQSVGTPITTDSDNYFPVVTYDSANDKLVMVYADGGTTQAAVGTVTGTSITFGAAVEMHSTILQDLNAVYDNANEKIVVLFKDPYSSDTGKAVVGTVSGTSISFGSFATFESGATDEVTATFDSNAGKVVVAYQDEGNSNYGKVAVGTVSGTSISFGTPVAFNSASTFIPDITFDSVNNKVVIAYKDGGNSSYGTAIVGTVSGTTISFGSEVVWLNSTDPEQLGVTFDSTNGKVVLVYKPGANPKNGHAIVGTVSNTSISFGTAVVFESGGEATYPKATFDPLSGKVVVTYRDVTNSNYGTAIVGTVSGTSISFGTAVVFDSTGAYTASESGRTHVSGGRVVLGYAIASSRKVVVFQIAYEATNLTSENYIGLASNGYPDTATATIDVQGAINDRQSGLTAGQAYYVQTDGTLTTTAGDPSVFAGTAISATKMIVKG